MAKRRRASKDRSPLLAALVVLAVLLALCLALQTGLAFLPALQGQPINFLLLGIDRRGGSGWTYRTDTIMVLSVDPGSGAASLLSIPRDLQLTIPGHGDDRINTANVYGYLEKARGGGPGLLKDTLEANLGIHVDHYLMIDFGTFERIVDTLGGIDLLVPEVLHDTRYPDPRPGDPHAFTTIHFDPGQQHMDGVRALQYARSRMSTSDFDRAKRQQAVLLAIRQRALRLGAVPSWPSLVRAVLDGSETDLNPGDLIALAFSAARLDPHHLKQVVIEPPLVYGYRRADGAAVELPNWDLLNPVLDELFR